MLKVQGVMVGLSSVDSIRATYRPFAGLFGDLDLNDVTGLRVAAAAQLRDWWVRRRSGRYVEFPCRDFDLLAFCVQAGQGEVLVFESSSDGHVRLQATHCQLKGQRFCDPSGFDGTAELVCHSGHDFTGNGAAQDRERAGSLRRLAEWFTGTIKNGVPLVIFQDVAYDAGLRPLISGLRFLWLKFDLALAFCAAARLGPLEVLTSHRYELAATIVGAFHPPIVRALGSFHNNEVTESLTL
jgi:hypothetical protein